MQKNQKLFQRVECAGKFPLDVINKGPLLPFVFPGRQRGRAGPAILTTLWSEVHDGGPVPDRWEELSFSIWTPRISHFSEPQLHAKLFFFTPFKLALKLWVTEVSEFFLSTERGPRSSPTGCWELLWLPSKSSARFDVTCEDKFRVFIAVGQFSKVMAPTAVRGCRSPIVTHYETRWSSFPLCLQGSSTSSWCLPSPCWRTWWSALSRRWSRRRLIQAWPASGAPGEESHSLCSRGSPKNYTPDGSDCNTWSGVYFNQWWRKFLFERDRLQFSGQLSVIKAQRLPCDGGTSNGSV